MGVTSSSRTPADDRPETLLERLEKLREATASGVDADDPRLAELTPERRASALNMLHYLALRTHDLGRLHAGLQRLGLAGLTGLEGGVLPRLDAMIRALRAIAGVDAGEPYESVTAPADDLLARETARLFGPAPEGRATRFMVTLPAATASDYMAVHQLTRAGMDCARINCSHDGGEDWAGMVANLRNAARTSGRTCRILMDISGPKLRIGPMQTLPPIMKIRPDRDRTGRVTRPARVWLTAVEPGPSERQSADACLRVDAAWLDDCTEGDKVRIRDARGASRRWRILRTAPRGCWAECAKSTYLGADTELCLKQGGATRIANLPVTESRVRVQPGDSLIMTGREAEGRAELRDEAGRLLNPGRVCVDVPAVYRDTRPGEKVCFDDGRVTAVIERVGDGELEVRITHTRRASEYLGSGRGVNLPKTRFNIPALSDEDRVDVEFAARHADLVALSFVNGPEDVRELRTELERLGRRDIGVVLKIETRRGVRNLPEILLEGLRFEACGVMIARGDLAVECGFERLAGLQDYILAVCETARVPVTWATQVMESLAKRGHPTRAEVTDAAAGQAAECLMLNKGPHILETLRMLDVIVRDMERRRSKGRCLPGPLRLPAFPPA